MAYFFLSLFILVVLVYFFDRKKINDKKITRSDKNIPVFYAQIKSKDSQPENISWNEKRDKWYIPVGFIKSELDHTKFPPVDYSYPSPIVGAFATIWQPPIKKLATIQAVKKGGEELIIKPEYSYGVI